MNSYLNFTESNYLFDLSIRFTRFLKVNNYIISNNIESLIIIIKFIEMFHRNIIWRVFEYSFLFLLITANALFKTPLRNYSIGIYQIKINLLFDLLNINYSLINKYIYSYSIPSFLILYNMSNNSEVLKNIICYRFPRIDPNELDYNDFFDILLFYSRNNEFYFNINYYNVAKYLHSENVE